MAFTCCLKSTVQTEHASFLKCFFIFVVALKINVPYTNFIYNIYILLTYNIVVFLLLKLVLFIVHRITFLTNILFWIFFASCFNLINYWGEDE